VEDWRLLGIKSSTSSNNQIKGKTCCNLIEQIPHSTYAEPFIGMGGVFFHRGKKPPCEIINDRNGEIANLFRILQRHYQPFMDMLKFQVSSREEFNRMKSIDPTTLTDLERAARFLYLQRDAFGGKVTSRTLAWRMNNLLALT